MPRRARHRRCRRTAPANRSSASPCSRPTPARPSATAREVDLLAGLCAAPTEHAGVCGHSIEALAQLGQPGRDELHLRPSTGRPAAVVQSGSTISSAGMYCASAMRHVFRCSRGTAVYAWTTAATSSAGSATGHPVEPRLLESLRARPRSARPRAGAGSGGTGDADVAAEVGDRGDGRHDRAQLDVRKLAQLLDRGVGRRRGSSCRRGGRGGRRRRAHRRHGATRQAEPVRST